jgi:hypothetical protein
MVFAVIVICPARQWWPWVGSVDMQDDWAELSEIEARVTAQDRLDLHYEHRDARDVERGSWKLADYLRGCREAKVTVGERSVAGGILTVGTDWMHLTSAIVCLDACEGLVVSGVGNANTTVLDFRKAVRQLAGRIPREIVLRSGRAQLVAIDWVARDFMQVRSEAGKALIPLSQVAVIFGRVEIA